MERIMLQVLPRIMLVVVTVMFGLALQPGPVAAGSIFTATGPDRIHVIPKLALRVTPNTPRPGDVIIARVTTETPAQVVGRFGRQVVRFAPDDAVSNGTGPAIP